MKSFRFKLHCHFQQHFHFHLGDPKRHGRWRPRMLARVHTCAKRRCCDCRGRAILGMEQTGHSQSTESDPRQKLQNPKVLVRFSGIGRPWRGSGSSLHPHAARHRPYIRVATIHGYHLAWSWCIDTLPAPLSASILSIDPPEGCLTLLKRLQMFTLQAYSSTVVVHLFLCPCMGSVSSSEAWILQLI